MNNIDTIMYLLDWERTEEEQERGLMMAREVKCLRAFFQPCGPGYCKSVWENCAKIVCERSDSELNPHISEMLAWLEDINWPGALRVQQRLLAFSDTTMLKMAIEYMIPALIALDEISWLISISKLLENTKLKASLDQEEVRFLEKYAPKTD